MERHKYYVNTAGKDHNRIRKAITSGFFMHAGKKDPNEGFRTLLDN
jgi:ATP-dependent RNA helicase DHX8/PRP22